MVGGILCEAACYIAIAGGCAAGCEWQVVGVGGFNFDGGENLEELLGCGSKEMRMGFIWNLYRGRDSGLARMLWGWVSFEGAMLYTLITPVFCLSFSM